MERILVFGMTHGYHHKRIHGSYLILFQVLKIVELLISSIRVQERTWDVNLVHGLLSLEEATLVLSIPLSHTPVEDKIIWPFTPLGNYTVNLGSKFLDKLTSLHVPAVIHNSKMRFGS